MKDVAWPTDQAVVLLEEEYGYRSWVWWTGMTDDELIQWWKSLESVSPYFFDPRELPGTLTPQYGLCREQPSIGTYNPKTIRYNEEDEPFGEVLALERPAKVWIGHIHEDGDSDLFHPDYGRVHHRGYGREMMGED